MSSTHESGSRPAAGSRSRRRPRQHDARPRSVRLPLTEEEFADLEQAAVRAGLAKAAYAAEAALAAARGQAAEPDALFQDALAEVIRAAGHYADQFAVYLPGGSAGTVPAVIADASGITGRG